MSTPTPAHDPRGSLWNRWDLHFHTPSSYDYKGGGTVTNQAIVDRLVAEGVRVVAITDHHTMDLARIRELQKLGAGKLTVLPGIELRSDQGGDPIHYICIFAEDCQLDHVWTTLQGKWGLTTQAIKDKGGDDKVYVPIEDAGPVVQEVGGVISIHAGAKSNSIESIKNKEQFQQRIKYDITKNWVDLLEIGQVKDIDVHLNMIFPATGLEKPLILCSDNHGITDYSVKAPLWFRADPTFRGLLMVLQEPQGRVFIGARPPELIRHEQNRTKYVRKLSFTRKGTAQENEKWFHGHIDFNPGLVAIVGNKGSGKSALSDMLGLLGASKNPESFSFLNPKRFRHPTGGHAKHFDATLEWASGEKVTKCLDQFASPEEIERLKYLPQDHVEKVCNELSGIGERNFETELKSVIFSHVPEAQRLGQVTLDELVRFQTDEKQKRIDTLLGQLREASRARATAEAQSDPLVKQEVQEKITRRNAELEAHDGAKPAATANPAATAGGTSADPTITEAIAATEVEKAGIEKEITKAREDLGQAERQHAVAKRLLEKISNFAKEFKTFQTSLGPDATELKLTVADLATLTLKPESVEKLRDMGADTINKINAQLKVGEPANLIGKLGTSEAKLVELKAKLDAPNRIYQAYLAGLGQWQTKRNQIVGNENSPESIKGLEALLASLDKLPDKIDGFKKEQARVALEIHAEKIAQADVFRTLYGPVQNFIDSHPLAKDTLKLEFKAELANEGFTDRLMELVAQNKRGSFFGINEGRAKSESFVELVKWAEPESVSTFLQAIDDALHNDQRGAKPVPVQLRDQLARGKKSEEIFNLIYGLEYVAPRYVLRWQGKDIAMLSPGERGTLLLVFYLLIDKGDMPLVIDQPEGNLDNHTVAKVLVECIREARKRRQVFIVTHNPNLAVVCDADQVVHASMEIENGNEVTYTCGALENPTTSQHVTDVLEGTRWAFGVRGEKYKVGE